jgi:hypothetical protein
MSKMIILDNASMRVHVFYYDEAVYESGEHFFEEIMKIEYDVKESKCS